MVEEMALILEQRVHVRLGLGDAGNDERRPVPQQRCTRLGASQGTNQSGTPLPGTLSQFVQPVQGSPGSTRPGREDRLRRRGLASALRFADHWPAARSAASPTRPATRTQLRPVPAGAGRQVLLSVSCAHLRLPRSGRYSVTGLLLPIIFRSLPRLEARTLPDAKEYHPWPELRQRHMRARSTDGPRR